LKKKKEPKELAEERDNAASDNSPSDPECRQNE